MRHMRRSQGELTPPAIWRDTSVRVRVRVRVKVRVRVTVRVRVRMGVRVRVRVKVGRRSPIGATPHPRAKSP